MRSAGGVSREELPDAFTELGRGGKGEEIGQQLRGRRRRVEPGKRCQPFIADAEIAGAGRPGEG